MKLYKYTNKAPIGCNDCSGCDSCCHLMGDTIIQDPYDMWNFCSHMKISGGQEVTFDLLISEDGPWELSEQGHMLLPNIKMVDDGVCPFLGKNKRCTIHSIRSGLCRLYPLGRKYELSNGSSGALSKSVSDISENDTDPSSRECISYYVLPPELGCEKIYGSDFAPSGDPVLISDWLGIPNPDKYHDFLLAWHSVKNDMRQLSEVLSEANIKDLQGIILQIFYETNYDINFYPDFEKRMAIWKGVVGRIS